jgi:hypothetical protein
MPTSEWIESAGYVRKAPTGGGMVSNYQHIMTMARADEKREAEDRVLAARTVQRIGREHAGELLTMLGLDAAPDPKPRVKPKLQHGAVAEKLCPNCGETRPAAEYVRRPKHKDGLETYCRPCGRKKKNEWTARQRAKTGALS